MTFIISRNMAMNILDTQKKSNMRIHILKNYIKDLQTLLDANCVDYSELRKKYLFQYEFTKNNISSEDHKRSEKYLRRLAGSNNL